MKSVFMVAEKPSLAASLASILSNGRHSTHKGKNYIFFFVAFFNENSFEFSLTAFISMEFQVQTMHAQFTSGKVYFVMRM